LQAVGHAHQAAELKQHAILADPAVALAQAVALKWLLLADLAAVLHLRAALKSLLAILAELHPATADVASGLANAVCSLRFSSANPTTAAMQL